MKAFTDLMGEIVETLSNKYVAGEKSFKTEQEISLQDWRGACEWIKLKRTLLEDKTEQKTLLKIYVPSSTFENTYNGVTIGEKHVNKYIYRSWKTFEQYKKTAFSIYMIDFDAKNWKNSTCSCPHFYKNYKCKHIIGIAITKKILKPPQSANVDPFGMKNKKGRKPNAVKALLIN